MSARLNEMQAMYRIQTEEAKRITEDKFNSKLTLVRQKLAKAENHNEAVESNLYSMADVEELCQQIDECEEEINRMKAHLVPRCPLLCSKSCSIQWQGVSWFLDILWHLRSAQSLS